MENQFERARTEKRLHELIRENDELEARCKKLEDEASTARLERDLFGIGIREREARVKDLLKMLRFIFFKTNFQAHFPTTSIKVKNLLNEYKDWSTDE